MARRGQERALARRPITGARLQVYSQRFTELGRVISGLHRWLAACPAAKSLNTERALATLPAVAKALLGADHAVVYRYVDTQYWAIGPPNFWVSKGVARQPEDIGRGMAGYIAQVRPTCMHLFICLLTFHLT